MKELFIEASFEDGVSPADVLDAVIASKPWPGVGRFRVRYTGLDGAVVTVSRCDTGDTVWTGQIEDPDGKSS